MSSFDGNRTELLLFVSEIARPVFDLGGSWMASPEEEVATEAAGLKGWQLYFLGRHGVLGDVDPDVIVAAAYIFPPEHLARDWEAARAVLTPEEAVERYVTVCHEWGRAHFEGFSGVNRLAELAEKVIDSVDVAGLSLFAGWRALPVPLDPPARCAHAMQLLREHRGGCHGLAIVASGMTPLMAQLASPDPNHDVEEYGWQPPYPAVTDDDVRRRAAVEELTDELTATGYEVLDKAERAEFLTLIHEAVAYARPTWDE